MAHYTIRIGPQGPLLSCMIGVSVPRKAAMQAQGVPIPPAVVANLVVDTGASGTAIDVSVIAQLGLQPTGTESILTPSTGATPHVCSTYDVELLIPGGFAAQSMHLPALPVIEGHFQAQGHHGLLGRNVLKDARMVYSGVDGVVILSF